MPFGADTANMCFCGGGMDIYTKTQMAVAAGFGRLCRVHPPKLAGRLYEYLTYGGNIHQNTLVQPLLKYQI